MMKRFTFSTIITVLLFIFMASVLALSIRGIAGNPTREELNNKAWKDDGPFELSPERGRFALTYSIVEDHSFSFDLPIAVFAIPDLGLSSGRYVSLFAPGVSFIVMPGYITGKLLGNAQIGTFAVIGVFALINCMLIIAIARRLGAYQAAAMIAGIAFLFGSPAFSYAVSLYQHHISTFLILMSIYALLRWKNTWSIVLVWFLSGVSILVDYPNVFMMIPILMYSFLNIVQIHRQNDSIVLQSQLRTLLAIFVVLIPMVFFLWYNNEAYGNPFQLSGTLRSVKEIDNNGQPITAAELAKQRGVVKFSNQDRLRKKTATGFFLTRNLLGGFYTHMISPDRGVLWFTPIIILGLAGMIFLYTTDGKIASLFASIVGVNILLYSMWSDPYGGWAFGSRYLIPSYAILSICIAVVLTHFKKSMLFLILFFLVFTYSVLVNTVGAITTSKNPPKVEAVELQKISGIEEKYTYERNIDFLLTEGSKSFVWREYLRNSLDAVTFYAIISGAIASVSFGLMVVLARKKEGTSSI